MDYRNNSIRKAHAPNIFLVWFLSISIALLPACASSPAIDDQRPLSNQVDSGDYVSIVLKDGTQEEFKVTRVDDKGLYNNDAFYAFSEISTVKQLNTNTNRMANGVLTVLGVLVVAYLVGFVAGGIDSR